MVETRRTLARFPVITTSDLEEARDAVTRVYLPHELSAEEPRLAMRLNAAPQKRFTLGFLAYGARTELQMPATETTYHINLTTRGETFAQRQDGQRAITRADASGVVLLPDQLNVVRWTEDAEQLILKIPRTRLESHLADLIGRPVDGPIDFAFGFGLTTPRGEALLAAVRFLAGELDRAGGITEAPLAREQLEAYVMTQLLLTVRNPYTDLLGGPVDRVRAARLQPVLDHMQAHADQPLTPGDLARVGCMSVRTLHATFRHELGVSPMAHLRRIRLDRVRAELLRSTHGDRRISDVAMRWGFYHPSRFAQQYQERFGELPSDTVGVRDTGSFADPSPGGSPPSEGSSDQR
jgi:AraC-like DNA-binding protein